MVYPSGRIVTYVRDALGRVMSVTTKTDAASPAADVATAITYMPFGPIASLTHGNALAATFTWDQDYRLTGIVTAQGGTTIQDLVYGFNLADNVTSITDNLATARNQSFTLDDLQRLTSATGAYGSITYSYDAADNRLTRNLSGGPAETFTYGTTNNRLQSAAVTGQPTRTFMHNSAGDITLDDRGSGNTVTIAIGADGRPQTITVAGTGATTVTYKHNAFGERVSRVEGAAATHFHYDQNGRLIAESDGTGAVIREYLWLGAKPIGLVVGPATSATLYFVHADQLARVQNTTDASQAIVWDGQFTPNGRTHAITGTLQNPLRFPGQWADPAAAYFYNYMRDYDPTLARYLSVDPLGTAGGRNKFSYAGANPQNLVDPSGQVLQGFLFASGGALAVHFALEYAIQRLEHKCGEFAFDVQRALRTAPYSLLFGLAGQAFRLGRLGVGLAGALGGLEGIAASRAASTLSGQAPGLFRRFLADESGALHLNNLMYQGDTLVYRILNAASGETFKYGITSRLPVAATTLPSRVARQLRKLGPSFEAEAIATLSTRAEARALEKLLNVDYYVMRGRLPLGSRRF